MKADDRARLESAGWKFGTVAEFLGLSPEDEAEVEARVELELARRRVGALISSSRKCVTKRITQQQLAELMGSSQSRVAAAEAADESVSLDLMVRAALSAGANIKQVGAAVAGIDTVSH